MGRLAIISTYVATLLVAGATFAQSTTKRVAHGLTAPLFVTHAPGDYDRIFIIEQGGKIKVLRGGVVLPQPFLDLSSDVAASGEMGLLGLAFHPDYATNGHFYVNYAAITDKGLETIVLRHQVSATPDLADAASGQMVLRFDQPLTTHNGGWIGFGPDGYLYIASGDGGRQIPENNAQNITDNLLGKILRIDVNADAWPDDADRNYAIPPTNPFVDVVGADEIWVYGLRNPWRCAFDSLTDDFFITDVGEDAWEEINFVGRGEPGGIDFGWRCKEGNTCSGLEDCSCVAKGMVDPIYIYANGPNCSITGGEVYRGCAIPELFGAFLFADFCSGNIWSMTYDGTNPPVITDRTADFDPGDGLSISRVSSFGRDAFGEVYICDWSGGEVFKIVPFAAPAPIEIADSMPPNDAIDARQPSDPSGERIDGWDSVQLRFSGCVANVVAGDFIVSQDGGVGSPPSVSDVLSVSMDTVCVIFSQPIAPRAWTTITHIPSGTRVRLGALPGDCDANRITEASDLLILFDALGDPPTAHPARSMDIDRSGRVTACDILREIDLLLGSSPFDMFNGATLP